MKTIKLRWLKQSSASVDSYKVKYGTVSGSYDTTIDPAVVTDSTVDGTQMTSTNVEVSANGTYYLVVVAVKDGVESAPSLEVTAVVQSPPPPTPVDVEVVEVTY